MTHTFHRHTQVLPRLATHAQGVYIYDQDGKAYLDASGGAAVSCLGHGHPAVLNAIHKQVDQLAYAHSSFFTTEVVETLADFLAARSPGDQNFVYFVSGGSEGMEAALKLGRQYWLERGEPQRTRFIARRQSYHGNTLGALAVGGNQWRRQPFAPILMPTEHISPCYAYRDQRDDEDETSYGIRVADELETSLLKLGAENVIAFVAETVVGATAGVLPPVPGYLRRIRDICDRHGILLILDEVMCGMGRTGHLFASEEDAVAGDMTVIAKGLGGGYQPIGATLVSDRIYQTIKQGSGFFQHGHTYMGHATAAAAALAVQQTIENENLLANVRHQGEHLRSALRSSLEDHPWFGDVRGRGLFIGIELVADRTSKKPLARDSQIDKLIKSEAMDQGLMCYPMSGTINGQDGHHILLAPPFIIDDSHVDTITSKLTSTLFKVLRDNSG